MKSFISAAFVIAIVSGCRGGSGETLIDRNGGGPNAVPPPTDPSGPTVVKTPPPPTDDGPVPGCPSLREATTPISDAASVRAQLVGTYRSCNGGMGLELRLDPDSETRLLRWSLDDRFVRISSVASGAVDIIDCDGASATCDVRWNSAGTSQTEDSTIRVWTQPTALVLQEAGHQTDEWLRVAD